MHTAPVSLIRDLAIILGVAAVVTLVFQRIRQPVVLGYIIAGLIVGPYLLPRPLISDIPAIQTWAELGVIFLMFSVGLEFSFRKLARVGVSAMLTAWFEVLLMLCLGFGTGQVLRWSYADSIFLGAIVSISSTTIIVKALDELRLKTRRFAELILGVLVVEDLIAVLILVALSTIAVSHGFAGLDLLAAAGKLALVVGSWFLIGYFAVPRFVQYVGKLGNDEMLTIFSIGLCLLLAVLAASRNYSVALGAFIMGSILAESTESNRIRELIGPLRDLFAAIFFVSVGMLIDPKIIAQHLGAVALITAVLLFGKMFNITLGALITGQTFRTSVQVGMGMAQIGEFSFIIATIGYSLGATSPVLYPIAVAVSVITTFTTPYLIRYSHTAAVWLEDRIPMRFKDFLMQYAAWAQERRADRERRTDFYRRGARWALNGILVTVAFIVVGELVLPLLEKYMRNYAAQLVGWTLAVVCASPFLWAMFSTFRGFGFAGAEEEKGQGGKRVLPPYAGVGTLFFSRFFAAIWLGAVSLEFFSARLALAIVAVIVCALMLTFRQQLGTSYRWFETRFLSTFQITSKSKRPTDVFRHLAPWDAHLVRFKVHPNSDLAGACLSEIDLRDRYGMNVIVIQRGLKTIVAPSPAERIYPKDELLVLGTDEQVDAARRIIEKPPGLAERFRDLSGYELRRYLITDETSFANQAIRESHIRERFGGMVVGIERQGQRVINPSSSYVLKVGDVLWIVGDTDRLKDLA